MDRRVQVVLNATAGTGRNEMLADILPRLFADHGIAATIVVACSGAEVTDATRRALADHADTIVAGGGDGTLNTVASAVADTEVTVGILPLGTFNHFAKDLGIPLDLDAAVATIAAGRTRRVDAGSVNGHIFLNNSSFGLYSKLVEERRKQQQRLGRGKWSAFAWSTLAVLHRYPVVHVRLIVKGRELERRTPLVFVGNNVYEMEGFRIGKRARLDSGELSLYVPRRTGRLGLFLLALRAVLGRLHRDHDFDAFTTDELHMDTRRKSVRVAVDGEVIRLLPPLHYRIRPGALRVLAP
jgi:diacylglycerol kinase family enzyme